MMQHSRPPGIQVLFFSAATALLWLCMPATVMSAPLRPAQPPVESASLSICEDSRCGTSVAQSACAACSLYRQEASPQQLQEVHYRGFLVEGGVAVSATSEDPQVQVQLFSVALARNEILQRVHEGEEIALCEPCHANVRSFVDVRFGVERIHKGVILTYTSSRDDLVELLRVMLLNGHDLPL